MTNPKRFFMVNIEVTDCCNCPYSDMKTEECLSDIKTAELASNRWIENVQKITPSCPLYGQSQEEKK